MVDADGVVKTRVDDAYLTPGEIKGLAKDVASNAETT